MHLLVVLLIIVQTGSSGNNFIKEKEETVSSETELPNQADRTSSCYHHFNEPVLSQQMQWPANNSSLNRS
jgi:hypothetical protein